MMKEHDNNPVQAYRYHSTLDLGMTISEQAQHQDLDRVDSIAQHVAKLTINKDLSDIPLAATADMLLSPSSPAISTAIG